jgi:hypothetical protein
MPRLRVAFQFPAVARFRPRLLIATKMARFRFARLRGHIQLWIRRTLIAAGKPPMDELLRIVAAVGITLAVAALAVMFFMWVFS